MQRSKQTTQARRLVAMVAFGLMCTPALSAEPWYSWRKSPPATESKPSSGVKPLSERPVATKPATTANATTPTASNRRQAAPVSAGATKPASEKSWGIWKASKAEDTPGTTRIEPISDESAPVVVKKSAPPPTVTKVPAPRKSAPAEIERSRSEGAAFETESNAAKRGELVPLRRPGTSISSTPTVPKPATRPATQKVRPVTFLEVAEEELPPPVPPEPSPDLLKPTPEVLSNTQILLPPSAPGKDPKIQLQPVAGPNELISLTVRDAPLSTVLSLIAEQHGLNLVAGSEVEGRVTVTLTDVALDDALNSLLTVNGYSWHRNRNILVVSKVDKESKSSPELRGVALRVFRLNYVAADDVDKVVQTLLSPAGHAAPTMVDSKNNRRTREELVVEDLPEYLARIEMYIAEVDRPPRQVLIEAHVLQVNLKDDCRHGVNIKEMFDVSNTKVSLETKGFANPQASPAFFFGIENNNFQALVEALKVTTDSKTLATPQVLCLNGQRAKIQIGQQLGFLVTTTTQTSTLQNVNFLDVGVVLEVTPTITEEGLVMMQVKPEVSGGQINAAGLPQEDTTEVETTVMLADGSGMIIGGLIKEEDTEVQTKVPWLGDLWLVGRLFQRRTVMRQRNEVIIALVPYIVPYPENKPPGMDGAIERARSRLLTPDLERMDRRQWEADLPDAVRNPKVPLDGEIKMRVKDPYAISRPPEPEFIPPE